MATETKKKVVKAVKPKKTKTEEEVVATEATEEAETGKKVGAWIFGLGRRKSAVARVKLVKNGKGAITIEGMPVDEYFGTYEQRDIVKKPLQVVGQETAVDVIASVDGGGVKGQAEAVRLGICRALVVLNPTYRKTLKKLGYMTRDPRSKERKKFGLKRARRAPQWSKR